MALHTTISDQTRTCLDAQQSSARHSCAQAMFWRRCARVAVRAGSCARRRLCSSARSQRQTRRSQRHSGCDVRGWRRAEARLSRAAAWSFSFFSYTEQYPHEVFPDFEPIKLSCKLKYKKTQMKVFCRQWYPCDSG